MSTLDKIVYSANEFYNDLRSDPNGRYLSWEHCYKQFHDARNIPSPDYDYLSLHLAFYLASWGMYRGSSFLLQKDYQIHTDCVREILKPEYNCLCGIECASLKKPEIQKQLETIEQFIRAYYDPIRRDLDKNVKADLSVTLITKILMGTLGCVPAYDRYFVSGIKSEGVASGHYGIKSLLQLVDFYEKNKYILEQNRKKMTVFGLPYPQMKLLDMGFWKIGFELDDSKGHDVAH